jgi:5-methylcytosine-specific restriction endonuclease McrA
MRREVWLHAQGFCQHCGCYIPLDGPFEVDHVIAWSRGGSTSLSNSQLLCGPCNRKKGSNDDPRISAPAL